MLIITNKNKPLKLKARMEKFAHKENEIYYTLIQDVLYTKALSGTYITFYNINWDESIPEQIYPKLVNTRVSGLYELFVALIEQLKEV